MKNWVRLSGAFLIVLSFGASATGELGSPEEGALKAVGKDEISFKDDVKPIIHDYCLNCHIPGGKGYEKSGLDLSSYENLMKGTRFGPVVKPGDAEASTFTKLLEGTVKGLKMPAGLNAAGTLDRQYIMILKKWVRQGAKNN